MPLDPEHLQYSQRRYGMDHDRYSWSMLSDRKKIRWPNNNKVALWVNVCLQFFPLNQKGKPFAVPGGMTMPYPDLRHFTLRDYGNRVGIYRFLNAFNHYQIKPTFALNTCLAEQNPYLLDIILERKDEISCHGWHMDALHYGGQEINQESELIKRSLGRLRELTRQDIRGWLSPARNESANTPELLAANGIDYFSDWANDDMPYQFRTDNGPLWAMPLSNELEDRFIIMDNLHSEDAYVQQVCDACDFLLQESETQGGRILALNLHPWMLGQPHRINRLEQVLEYITSRQGVWSASAGDILNAFRTQQ
ncbi:MAG: polysaccharide deacetylase family protein [Porticoccaceae bacterium]